MPRPRQQRCLSVAGSSWSAQQTAEFRQAVTIAGSTLTVLAAALVGWGIVRTRSAVRSQETGSIEDPVESSVSCP